jgi:DNA helicase-2/ATP-dependent DNA helicase PcrA
VVEAIEYEQNISTATKQLIDVDTYHAFFWRILKTHGYLIGLPRKLGILTPPSEAIALSGIRSVFPARNLTDGQKEAKKAAEAAERIRHLIATMYPVVILDEFQDTNDAQWHVVQALLRRGGRQPKKSACIQSHDRTNLFAAFMGLQLLHCTQSHANRM